MVFKFSSRSEKEYDRVQDDDCSSNDSEALLSNPTPSRIRSLFDPRGRGPWIIATTLLIPYTIALFVILLRAQRECQCQCPVGFDTEFAPVRELISLQQVRFSGTPIFDPNGTVYRSSEPGQVRYTGEPGPELDAAWNKLLERRYWWYTEEEAKEAFGPSYSKYYHNWLQFPGSTGYTGGIEVLHTLHCLNELRKGLSPDYYRHRQRKLHTDHCIDQIRQVLMCNADLTPVPTMWHDSILDHYIDADQVHTCRNFDAIRAWASTRNSAGLTHG